MATVNVEMLGASGIPMTIDVFELDNDTAEDSQSATEASNRKQLWEVAVTLTTAGIYHAHMKTTTGSTPMGSGYFPYKGGDPETVRVGSYAEAVAAAEDGSSLVAIPWNPAWDAEVESEVDDALNAAIAELGVGVPTDTPSIRSALMLMYMAMRNPIGSQTSSPPASLEIYNAAGVMIAKKLFTDDGSDYAEAEMISG